MRRVSRAVVTMSAVAALLSFSAQPAGAASSWSAGSGVWTTSAAWTPNGTPASANDVAISTTSVVTVTINSGAQAANSLIIGDTKKGILTISGGGLAITNSLIIGDNTNGAGALNISAGTLGMASGTVGNVSTGTLGITGGTVTVDGGTGNLQLAVGSNSKGILNMSGGTLDATTVNGGLGTSTVNFTPAAK